MPIELATELAAEFRKHAARYDETAELAVENLRVPHDAGLDMAWLPAERGGQGRPWQDFGTVLTIIARACPSTATVWLMHPGGAYGLIGMSDEPNAAFLAGRRHGTPEVPLILSFAVLGVVRQVGQVVLMRRGAMP